MSAARESRDQSRMAYTSIVVAWMPAAAAVLVALGIASAALVAAATPPGATLVALLIIAVFAVPVGLHLGCARLTLAPTGLTVGAGLRGRTRFVPLAEIAEHRPTSLSWPQVYGIGLPKTWRMTRLTVRAGPTLRVRLRSGEQIWVSTDDPETADRLLADWHRPRPRTGNHGG